MASGPARHYRLDAARWNAGRDGTDGVARVNDRCGRPGLCFELVEDRLRTEPGDFCSRVTAARAAADAAGAVLAGDQRSAFMELPTDSHRRRFHADRRRYCRNRPIRD